MPWLEAGSRVSFSWVTCGSFRDKAACSAGALKSISSASPIYQNQPKINDKSGVLDGVSCTTISLMVDISSGEGEQ